MEKRLVLKAALVAGLAAGVVFMMLEMALVALVQGESPWAPPRMIAAIALGKDVLPPPASFDADIFAVAMAIHFALAVVLAIILAWGIARLGFGTTASTAVGAVFGVTVYYVNFFGFTELFPWFAMARGLVSLVAHAVFGAVSGGLYQLLAYRSAGRAASGPEQRS